MTHADAADTLEAILIAENDALERHDALTAVALLERKLAAARALSPEGMEMEQGLRLRALAAENRRLLERAIDVQGRIITMVAKAAQASASDARYGAAGRTIQSDRALALARQA